MTMYVTSKTQELNVGEMMSALNEVALPKLRDLKNMGATKRTPWENNRRTPNSTKRNGENVDERHRAPLVPRETETLMV